ncbi:MAG: hypothetical protein JW894_05980 [Bacteroidales bacterium]|nr:hypothetical protein [Bacteroidales bacterium]
MNYCSYCGVELDIEMDTCPLCGTSVTEVIADVRQQEKEIVKSLNEGPSSEKSRITKTQKRKLFWELSMIIMLLGISVTFLIDLLTSGRMGWSKYSVTICFVLAVNISIIHFWRNRLILCLAGSYVLQSLLLVLFDTYAFNIGWAMQLGIPMLAIIYIAILIFIVVIRFTREHGINLIGYFFIASGILSFGIEVILDRYFNDYIKPEWSLFVIISVVPIALILLFVHYRLNKGKELRRIFHI